MNTQAGTFVHVPSWKVRAIVGLAACPVPEEVSVITKAPSFDVVTVIAFDAVLPHPALTVKSPTTKVVALSTLTLAVVRLPEMLAVTEGRNAAIVVTPSLVFGTHVGFKAVPGAPMR